MKYFLLSDIHGSRPALERALRLCDAERCDMLLLLGDILNYGPRNGLPEGLDPQGVAALLNERAAQIVAVRGNCDSEVDQMLLRFPLLADYALIADNGRRLLLTHGHLPAFADPDGPAAAPLTGGVDLLVTGHTHLWNVERRGRLVLCNTGSPTFPKEGRPPTCAIYEDGRISVRRLDGQVLGEMQLPSPEAPRGTT